MSPIEQFKIKRLMPYMNDSYDFSITNSNILLLVSTIIAITTIRMYPVMVRFVYQLLPVKDERYRPLIISLLFFILINNLLGLIPYSFTTTSHLIINLSMSYIIILGITLIGLMKHKINFIKVFIPKGLPKVILPLIFIIELISYLSRVISLSVRLTANMLSGHILLILITSYSYLFLTYFPSLFILPIFILLPFLILELAIAFIQSYVFAVLTASYIDDMVYLNH